MSIDSKPTKYLSEKFTSLFMKAPMTQGCTKDLESVLHCVQIRSVNQRWSV